MVEGFHFLRPAWFLALPVVLLLVLLLRRLGDPRQAWRDVIDPHLLDALLVVRGSRARLGPVHVLGFGWVVGILALAGPAWRREPAPFAEDTAAFVVVMSVTGSMTSEDVQPSRLRRAAQKVGDLLERRPDADCALFAYAGSAHRVMPLTRDAELIATFATSLAPAIMPVQGGDAVADAVELANAELRRAARAGSIVLVADGASADQVAAIRESGSVPVHVLGMGAPPELAAAGAPPPDFDALRRIASDTGGSFVRVRPDASDVERLAASAERRIGTAAGEEDGAHWRDDGYWLVPLIALAVLFWSRRGWAVAIPGARP